MKTTKPKRQKSKSKNPAPSQKQPEPPPRIVKFIAPTDPDANKMLADAMCGASADRFHDGGVRCEDGRSDRAMWEVNDEHIIALSKRRESNRLSYEVWVKQGDDDAKLLVAYIAGRRVAMRLPEPEKRESKARARKRLCRMPGIIMGDEIQTPNGDRVFVITV